MGIQSSVKRIYKLLSQNLPNRRWDNPALCHHYDHSLRFKAQNIIELNCHYLALMKATIGDAIGLNGGSDEVEHLKTENRSPKSQYVRARRQERPKRFEYDDSIIRQMTGCIKVYPDGKLEIIFGCGYMIEDSIITPAWFSKQYTWHFMLFCILYYALTGWWWYRE